MSLENNRIKVLFVCLGNICRSPSAEGVMKSLVKKETLDNFFEIDSAGTIGYHAGERADERMIRHALKRNIELDSIARKFNPDTDFEKFDYIITMDDENYRVVNDLDKNNKYKNKIFKMVEFSKTMNVPEVPDPYYGGSDGFELVLDILEDACEGLLEKLKDEIQQRNSK